ncbi:MerR family transcriptional regulator [Chitinophaga silvisoli]
MPNSYKVTAHTIKELADLYGVSRAIIKTWLKPFEVEIGPRQGYYYTVAQITIIYSKIGPPPM